jgi:hypothetical protein
MELDPRRAPVLVMLVVLPILDDVTHTGLSTLPAMRLTTQPEKRMTRSPFKANPLA